MKLYFGKLVYHWRMWGLVGRNAGWFIGLSIAPVVDEAIGDDEPIPYEVTPAGFDLYAEIKDGFEALREGGGE